jgi:hypothetical protein
MKPYRRRAKLDKFFSDPDSYAWAVAFADRRLRRGGLGDRERIEAWRRKLFRVVDPLEIVNDVVADLLSGARTFPGKITTKRVVKLAIKSEVWNTVRARRRYVEAMRLRWREELHISGRARGTSREFWQGMPPAMTEAQFWAGARDVA